MLIDFFYTLRSAKLPVSVKEFLMLLDTFDRGFAVLEPLPPISSFQLPE